MDDVLVTEYDCYGPLPLPAVDAFVYFAVDGDKSGGTVREFGDDSMVIQESSNVQAQTYSAFAKNYGNDSNVTLNGISFESSWEWMHQVPYADGGGIIVDSRPLFYVVEFYVTPFDRIVWDVPECSWSEPRDLSLPGLSIILHSLASAHEKNLTLDYSSPPLC